MLNTEGLKLMLAQAVRRLFQSVRLVVSAIKIVKILYKCYCLLVWKLVPEN